MIDDILFKLTNEVAKAGVDISGWQRSSQEASIGVQEAQSIEIKHKTIRSKDPLHDFGRCLHGLDLVAL